MTALRVVDYFAGAGGFTLGAQRAGARVVCAINHDPVAVETHQRNHPEVDTRRGDLVSYDTALLPAFDLLVASPACQGHSRARGVAPGTDDDRRYDPHRATAWAVVDAAEHCRPWGIVVENVPDFARWTLYASWKHALRRLGYAVRAMVCDAARWGVAQERVRLIVTAVLSPPGSGRRAPFVKAPKQAPRPIGEVIRWSEGPWSPIERPGRSAATLARVRRGREAFGHRFVMAYNGSGSGLTGRSLARPIGTVTAADRWAVVDGPMMRMLSLGELRAAMGFPEDYELPTQRHHATRLLGNAIVPALACSAVEAVSRAIA